MQTHVAKLSLKKGSLSCKVHNGSTTCIAVPVVGGRSRLLNHLGGNKWGQRLGGGGYLMHIITIRITNFCIVFDLNVFYW